MIVRKNINIFFELIELFRLSENVRIIYKFTEIFTHTISNYIILFEN